MNRVKILKTLLKNKKALIGLIFFVGSLIVLHYFVLLYGDDYYHSTAAETLKGFFDFHIHHYLKANGRALIHIAITSFFFGEGVQIWKVLSPVLFGLIVVFTATACGKTKDFSTIVLTMIVVFWGLGGRFTSHSIYTLTPVFNYVYPFLLIFPLLYYAKETYNSDKSFKWMPVLGFFAGATMEQTGIIAIGYIVMLAFEKLIENKQFPNKTLIITFITTLAGYLTVMLAPGNFVRMGVSTNPFSENFIAAFTMLINQKTFLFFNAILICSLCYWLIRIKEKIVLIRIFNICLVAGLLLGYCLNLCLIFEVRGLNFDTPGIVDIGWKLFDLGYIFAMVYVPVYVFIKEKRWDILTHMIMAIGSIVILFFASVSEWRPLTPAIITFGAFISLTVIDSQKISKKIRNPILLVSLILSAFAFINNLTGVIQNYYINEINNDRVETYLENGDFTAPLVLLPVKDEETRGYAINKSGEIYTFPLTPDAELLDGYSVRFKEFYNIPVEVTIEIEE